MPTCSRRKMARAVSFMRARSWPRRLTCPCVGLSMPVRMLSRVVLPEPERPRSATNSPGRSCRSTPRSGRRMPAPTLKSRVMLWPSAIGVSAAIVGPMLCLLVGWQRAARRGCLVGQRACWRGHAALRRPDLHMIVVNAHVGAPVEWDAHDGLMRELEPPDTVDEDGLAVRFAGQPDHGAGAAVGGAGGKRGVAAYCVGAGAAVADGDGAVGDRGDAHIMGDDKNRQPKLTVQLAQQPQNLVRCRRVELAGRLVGEQQRRAIGKRHADRRALLLAARDLMWFLARLARDARPLHQLMGALSPCPASGP